MSAAAVSLSLGFDLGGKGTIALDTQRALVVEDDQDISALVAQTLTGAGFDVATAANGIDAVAIAEALDPDLITLDLTLPGMDGLEVCRRVRERSDCYVIMLTARHEEVDRLIGLEVGADDYMVKPFSPRELRARAAALFRRPRHGTLLTAEAPGHEAINGRGHSGVVEGGGGLVINRDRREVTINDHLVPLTRTEFDLLDHLASRAGTVCTRSDMVRAVWETDFTDDQHLVDVHIANLRRKLRQGSTRTWIHTVRGVGYRFDVVG
jgi:DNA-binding response OmpR family regulator